MVDIFLKDTLSMSGEILDGEFKEVFRGPYITIVRDGADLYEILNTELNEGITIESSTDS